jgi:hypothetical protein
MAARSVSLVDMFNWVVEAFGLFGRGFGRFLLASLVTLLAFIAMMLPFFAVIGMAAAKAGASGGTANPAMALMGNMTLLFGMYALMLVLMLVFAPPLMCGWMRMCRHVDLGEPADALDVLRPYGDLGLWGRSIAFALLAGIVYIVVMAVIGFAFHGPFTEMMQAEMQALGGTPAPPHFSVGIVLAYAVFTVVGFVMQVAFGIGFAEIALRPTSPVQALGLAFGGTLRNLPKLLVLCFALLVAAVIAWLGVVLVMMVTLFVLMLASKALGFVVGGLLYVFVLLCVYPLMFGGQYVAWKGILDGDAPVGSGSPVMA